MVRTERHQQTVVWTVDRPSARNAIDESVVSGLESAVAEVEAEVSVRCVVLTGAGDKAFISGADLKNLRDLTDEDRNRLDDRMDAVLERIEALPVPVIGMLNGVAIGGGAEVMLACDVRVAESHATITFKHAQMGVTPGWGGLTRLLDLVNRSSAAQLLFTAAPIATDDALRIGLIDEVVPPGMGLIRALALGESIAKTSACSVAEIKRLLRSAAGKTREQAQREERQVFLERAQSSDHREALTAHFEKRAPNFTQRPR